MSPYRLAFLGATAPLERAKAVILGAPLERTESYRGGPAQAPTAIRLASDSLESYSAVFGVDIARIGVCDLGDLSPELPLGEFLAALESVIEDTVGAGKFAVVLGGEHTITLGTVRGAMAALGRLQLLALDAHSDLRDEYRGERICHATVLRRAWEVTGRLAIVGVRSFFGEEVGEPVFAGPQDFQRLLDPRIPVWLSVDLDALDPALCPGVTNPEPGGLSYREVVDVLKALREFQVVGMDIVELAPPFDPSGVSAITAAKLVIEALAALVDR
jgi:agmatinase